MGAVIFRCPKTALNVQGWTAEDVSPDANDEFVSIRCMACGGVHLVNPLSGRTLGVDEGSSEA
jgi:hypothetical protein